MRLGRSAAALGAAAALVVAGSAVSTPAFADEEDGFTVNNDYTGVADPNVPLTVSGTGCVAPDGPDGSRAGRAPRAPARSTPTARGARRST